MGGTGRQGEEAGRVLSNSESHGQLDQSTCEGKGPKRKG